MTELKANKSMMADIEEATMHLWANLMNGQVDGKEDLVRDLVKQWGWHEWREGMEFLDPKQLCVFEYREGDNESFYHVGRAKRSNGQEWWVLLNGVHFSSFNTVRWKRI